MTIEERITASHSVLMKLPASLSESEMRDVFLVYCALSRLGKTVSVSVQPSTPAGSLLQTYQPQAKEPTFVLTIQGIAPLITKLYYDKTQKDLKLHVTLSEGSIQKDDVRLESLSAPDLTIIVGQGNTDNNAISLDASLKQGLLSRFSGGQRSLVLLASLVLPSIERLPGTSLFMGQVSQTYLTETETGPKSLTTLIGLMNECFSSQQSYILLYETEQASEVRGVLFSPTPEIRDRMTQALAGQGKEQWVLFSLEASSLQQAKDQVTNILAPLWQKA